MKRALLFALVCATTTARAEPLFDFHARFWINLQQRLLAESGLRAPPDPLPPADAAQAAAWQRVLDWYRQRWPARTLMTQLSDDTLIAAERRLAAVADDAAPTGIDAELARQLTLAAPIYRARKWPDDLARDRAWIAELQPRLRAHGQRIEAALPKLFASPWPARPLRVEVSRYAGPVGAFTLVDPALITISSGDPRDAGDYGLEVLFHEASHTLSEPIERTLARVCPPAAPRTLWHAVLFWLSGAAVARELGAAYEPYAAHNHLYERGDWNGLGATLQRELSPYVDGKRALEPSLRALCGSF